MIRSERTTHPSGGSPSRGIGPRPIAWMDGRIVPAAEATIPLTDGGFLRGDGVFEAVLVRDGRTFDLQAHLARMRRSASVLGLRVPVLRSVVTDLLAAWGRHDGTLRLIVTRGGTVRGLLEHTSWPPSLSLAVLDIPWRTPLSGVKTLSYAINQWAIAQAQDHGADDALIVDAGSILELPTGAVGLVRDGQIVVPDPARLPILDSITVRALDRVADIIRATPDLDDLRAADEVFVVSASRPVLPVHAVGIGDDELVFAVPGSVTEDLQGRLATHILENLDAAG